jgi:hypothetical protein
MSLHSLAATSIELRDFVEQIRVGVPYVHPAGRATIDEWLVEMEAASERGDGAAVAVLAVRIQRKIDLELQWERETHAA